MHILFVSHSKKKDKFQEDPSFIYRCINLSLGLQKNGHTTSLLHITDLSPFVKADLIIFHRPIFSWRLWVYVKILQKRHIMVIADVDDLIFDPAYASDSPSIRNQILSIKKVQRRYLSHYKAFNLFDYFSVSTTPLYDHLNRLFSPGAVFLVPNAVFEHWKSYPSTTKDPNGEKKIAYFPGTNSHNRDFRTIKKKLEEFLNNHDDIKLYIVGKLSFELEVSSNQIEYHSKVPFDHYHNLFKDIWLNIAPLENTEFNRCKSALKVIEAGFWNIPTVAYCIDDVKRFESNGALCYLSPDDFSNHLQQLLDKSFYNQVSLNLRKKVLQKADAVKIAKQLINDCEEKNPTWGAKLRRKYGQYTIRTLRLYLKAYFQNPTLETYVAYCMFCRDLGYKLTKARAFSLQRLMHKSFNIRSRRNANKLLSEYQHKLYTLSKVQKKIYNNLNEWLRKFEVYIKNNQTICIVGNAGYLKMYDYGSLIDSHDIVVRFNNCCKASHVNMVGSKRDVWVSSPDIRETYDTQWVIISGPDSIYKDLGWSRFRSTLQKNGMVLTVPLHIWKDLVKILEAPPSAGLLMIYWIYSIRGSWSGVSIVGFGYNHKSSYHIADGRFKPSMRHNWDKEKECIKKWTKEGLTFLGKPKDF